MRRVLLVMGAALALVAGASAAKPQQTTGTLDSVTPAAPAHRDTITFGYTLTGPECNKRGCALIKVWCHDAAGTLLYTADRLAAGNAFYLESGTYQDGTPFWPSGTSAVCTAQLGGSPATGKLVWEVWGVFVFEVAGG